MEIIIDTKAEIVSVDRVSRSVVLPVAYHALNRIYYDTEDASGLKEPIGSLTMGGILAVSLALWHAAAPDVSDMWALIKAKRTQMNAGGVFVSGAWFHTDSETLAQYSIMYAAISVNSLSNSYIFNANWKTMDGTFRCMSVSLLKKIIHTGMSNAALNFANAERHRTALKNSPVPSKYDYSTGWVKVHT